jgi:uroporphyrinogen-III synthase
MRGIEIVPVPVVTIHDIPFEWPTQLAEKSPDWILFSSSAGVTSFCNQLERSSVSLPETVRIGTIGKKTTEAAVERGLRVAFQPSQSYGETLFKEFIDTVIQGGETVVYARAIETAFDPASLFAEKNIRYFPMCCYDVRPNAVESSIIESFDPEDYLLFTSPTAVCSFHEQFGVPKMTAIAIGNTTGDAMRQHGWHEHHMLDVPDITRVLEICS